MSASKRHEELMRIAIVGAGWAGLAAAVALTQRGHAATVFEAARQPGGRARAVPATLPDGRRVMLDNGQHILIGAYHACLGLLRDVGVSPADALLRQPLALRFADGQGLALPDAPAPLDALAGILRARGWAWGDKLSLLRAALGWRHAGFTCVPERTVAELCAVLTPRVRAELTEPLCLSALNTPAHQASAQVFLRVLRDALFAGPGASRLLLPRTDLGTLFPETAARWLAARGALVRLGARVRAVAPQHMAHPEHAERIGWLVDGEPFDRVVLACSPWEAARLARPHAPAWADSAQALRHAAIATVYAVGVPEPLPAPLLALRSGPAQFVFDRSQLGGPAGLLAFVISASQGDRAALEHAVLDQARAQLGHTLTSVQTLIEKRATFACLPALRRPGLHITPGLLACGDYVDGPYPATLESAAHAGLAAAQAV